MQSRFLRLPLRTCCRTNITKRFIDKHSNTNPYRRARFFCSHSGHSGHSGHTSKCANSALDFDTTVIGGGIVGLATARQLSIDYPNMRIAVVEKEDDVACHQSSHNSGVIHCGIYYKPGSLKAKLCLEGNTAMYEYCDLKNIEYKRTGKLIVAIDDSEIPRLENLYANGLQNNVPELKYLHTKSEIQSYEPLCDGGIKAIYCGTTGIINFASVAKSYLEDFLALPRTTTTTKSQNAIFLSSEVTHFSGTHFHQITDHSQSKTSANATDDLNFEDGVRVHYKQKSTGAEYSLTTANVITCAGIYSDRLSALQTNDSRRRSSSSSSSIRMVPMRGQYLEIVDQSFIQQFSGINIYPVPDPQLPVLGIHFTPVLNPSANTAHANTHTFTHTHANAHAMQKTDGKIICGPNVILAYGRESYSFFANINLRDVWDFLTFPGFWKLFAKHWRFGFEQLYSDVFMKKNVRQLQRYISSLKEYQIRKSDFAGIRAQAMTSDGEMVDDFVFDMDVVHNKCLNVRNAPSPAATSSLAIAKVIAKKAEQEFGWNPPQSHVLPTGTTAQQQQQI